MSSSDVQDILRIRIIIKQIVGDFCGMVLFAFQDVYQKGHLPGLRPTSSAEIRVSNLKCKREASLYTCTKQKQYKQILVYG